MNVRDKVIVVTGGASGIGAAMASRFVKDGAKAVYIADLDADKTRAFAEEIGAIGVRCDVTQEDQVVALTRLAEEAYGAVDLFCSNAGVAIMDGDQGTGGVGDSSNESWMLSWNVNVMAHVYAARAALPAMIAKGSGYFLNTASAAGLLSQIGSASYSTTKHAAIGFAESLAITHGDQGIGVSVLCPQAVATAMTGMPDGKVKNAEQQSAAVDGVLTPEQCVEAVIEGLDKESFLILPHPVVEKYMTHKIGDYDRWVGGMRKLRRTLPQYQN